MPIDIDAAFRRLAASSFRRKFHLQGKDLAYLQTWGLSHVMKQAGDLIRKRLAPAEPRNDGRQTPWRNHPVFVAQHATATCCRSCLQRHHDVPKGRDLDAPEREYVVDVILRWIERELAA